MVLLVRDLGARRECVVSFTPRPLYPRERPGIRVVRLKRGGTSLREKAGFKGETGEWSGYPPNEKRQVTACTALLPCYYYDVYTSPAST
jgi:hypothetical protein